VARILAVEPDSAQAAALARVIERAGAEPVMAESKEAAIAALDATTPDLILVSALLSPRDESELADHLRVREGVDHVQILTIPLLAVGDRPEPTRPAGGFLSSFRRKRAKSAPAGCDPDRYGDELKGYLKLAVEARAEREAQAAREERTRQRLNRASEAGASEASGAGLADHASTELIGAWEKVRETPLAIPAGSAANDLDPAPIWQSADEESLGSYGQTLDPMVEPVASMDLATTEVVAPTWEAPALPGTTLHPQADEPVPGPSAALEADAAPVADVEDDLGREPDGGFVLTPPSDTPEPDAALPDLLLDVEAQAAVPSAPNAPRLDFESWSDPERTPEIVEPTPMLAIEPAPDPHSPVLADLPPAVEEGTMVEAAAVEDPLAAAETHAPEAFEASGADPGPVAQAPFERASMPSLEFALGPDVLDKTLDARGSGAPQDDDRFSLSISSFEVDRRESDDYLLAAASDAFHAVRPLPAVDFPANASTARLTSVEASDIEESGATADAAPAVEIWQALPDWVETCPPLEAHMDHAPVRVAPERPAQRDLGPSGAKPEAPAPVPQPASVSAPPVDARWLATALDALRSDIQQLRTQAGEARAADTAPNPPPVLAEDTQPSPAVAAAPPRAARAPVPAPPPPVAETPTAPRRSAVAKEPTLEAPARKKKARKPKPVEDEWGMFDPSQAGVEALLAALDAKAAQEDAEDEDEPEEPTAPVDTEPVPASPRPRLAPLSMWAHTSDGQREVKAAPSREPNDLRALLDGLAVPTQVANVSYPTGCRIRRVRMVKNPGGRRTSGEADEPVIILSRRALGRGSAGKDDQGPPTPC
jgi:CheY-like chemotaxis protein